MASSVINRQAQVNQFKLDIMTVGMLLRPDRPSKDFCGKEMIISVTYEYI